MGSRGKLRDRNWRTSDDKHATIDDISVFVIPLKPYKEEYQEWTLKQETNFSLNEKTSSETVNNTNSKCDISESEVNMTTDKKLLEEETISSSSVSRDSDESVVLEKNLLEFKPQEDYFKDEANQEAQTEKHSSECLDTT